MGPGQDIMGPLVTFFFLAIAVTLGIGILIGWLI